MGRIWKKLNIQKLLIVLTLPLIIGCTDISQSSSSNQLVNLSSSVSSLENSSTSQNFQSSFIESSSSLFYEEQTSSSSEKHEIKHKILLIAGHGQNDVGAVSGNRKESEYNQNFVNQLIKKINSYTHKLEILVEPTPMKASDEAKLIASSNVDFALSIHFNAGGGKGSEMIVPFYETNFTFAYNFFAVLESNNFLIRETSVYSKSKNLKIKRTKNDRSYSHEDYFAVVRAGAKKKIPSYILEVEFIDNSTQMKIFDQRKDIYISLLAKSIVEYFI